MITPNKLLEHARSELAYSGQNKPRQADLHRAVSTAYYAAFHSLSQTVASEFVPAASKETRLVFARAIDHGKAKDICAAWSSCSDPVLRKFAAALKNLYQQRTDCDYNLQYKISKAETLVAITEAAGAMQSLDRADPGLRRDFLAAVLLKRR
ncbi:MAG: hypothetical protein EPN33_09115 [Acidobacteria bacterium]|nr:MAG: hypothetical protein EPN33_09115 [Acidobacteriota bacterium]